MAGLSPPPEPTLSRPRPIYKDYNVLQLALVVFLLDQLTKYLTIQLLAPGHSFPLRGFFRFTHVHNSGSAFGILQGLNTPLIFVSFIGITILVLIYRSQPQPNNWLRLSLGLQLGGAFGNLADRLRLGFVTDFIDIGPWPVFNLADASIVTGLVLLVWVFTRARPAPVPADTGQPPNPVPADRGPLGEDETSPPNATQPGATLLRPVGNDDPETPPGSGELENQPGPPNANDATAPATPEPCNETSPEEKAV